MYNDYICWEYSLFCFILLSFLRKRNRYLGADNLKNPRAGQLLNFHISHLSDNLLCHVQGPDANKREADLRLDTAKKVLCKHKRDQRKVCISRQATVEESVLYHRVNHTDIH